MRHKVLQALFPLSSPILPEEYSRVKGQVTKFSSRHLGPCQSSLLSPVAMPLPDIIFFVNNLPVGSLNSTVSLRLSLLKSRLELPLRGDTLNKSHSPARP
jgi:hypothetical protein